jgi:hypothetical protein
MVNVVTLDEARRHLRFPAADTSDDASLQLHIDAADEAISKECGDLIPTQYDEAYDGGVTSIYLGHRPIISVELVEEGWGFANYTLDYVQVNSPVGSSSVFSYSIDIPETGMITRRTAANVAYRFAPGINNVRVVYTAGRSPVPPVIKLAELELIAHWWQNSQQRASQNPSQYSYDAVNTDFPRSGAMIYTPLNQGVPYRILEMIKKYRDQPIIG